MCIQKKTPLLRGLVYLAFGLLLKLFTPQPCPFVPKEVKIEEKESGHCVMNHCMLIFECKLRALFLKKQKKDFFTKNRVYCIYVTKKI
jgi:hypothetical protein